MPMESSERSKCGLQLFRRLSRIVRSFAKMCRTSSGSSTSGASVMNPLALTLGLYVYLPVRQLYGEAGVLALATDGQRELIVGYDHLCLFLILVQVDLAYARRAQGLRYKARRLRVPLDDVDLLVPELGDHSPYAAPARPHAGPDGIYTGFLGPHGHLRAQPGFAGDSPYLDEAVVDLWHF